MTNGSGTRDEFETIKQLLTSTAAYAESANRQADRNSQAIADLRANQQETERQLQSFIEESQKANTEMRESQQATEQRLQSFISESQRLLTGHAERIQKLEGISERLEAILSYLVRKEGPGE